MTFSIRFAVHGLLALVVSFVLWAQGITAAMGFGIGAGLSSAGRMVSRNDAIRSGIIGSAAFDLPTGVAWFGAGG